MFYYILSLILSEDKVNKFYNVKNVNNSILVYYFYIHISLLSVHEVLRLSFQIVYHTLFQSGLIIFRIDWISPPPLQKKNTALVKEQIYSVVTPQKSKF